MKDNDNMAGRDIKINMLNSLPQVDNVLEGWEVSFYADYVYQVMVDKEPVSRSKLIRVAGVMQPLRTEEVDLKPEGQRAWSWYQVHLRNKYSVLRVQQIIMINNIPYKIMARKDYSLYGYNEYHVIRDYDEAA